MNTEPVGAGNDGEIDPDHAQDQGHKEQGGLRHQDGSVIQSVYIDKDALGDTPPEAIEAVLTQQ